MAGIYIHIPFCKTHCSYCDFFTGVNLSRKKELIDAMCKEIYLQKSYLQNKTIQTIYFGGGTPSLLTENEWQDLFNALSETFSIDNCEEITLEANPDDLTLEYASMLRRLPFNRISIGIQSFIDDELNSIRRRHTAQQAIDAVKCCQKAGFKNISIDLMYGLPHQTIESWKFNLQEALQLNIQHISAYHLTYEEGTVLYKQLKEKKIYSIEEDLSIQFLETLIDTLATKEFLHYEISNFALSGYESKHNSSYWKGTHYLGIGPAAHSFDGKSRQWNVRSLEKYIQGVENGLNVAEIEILSLTEKLNEFIMTRLRTMKGMDIEEFSLLAGKDRTERCINQAQSYLLQEHLELNNSHLRLTRSGIFISDAIISDLLFIE